MSGLFRSGLRAFGKYVIRPLFSKAARPYHNYIELNSKMYKRRPARKLSAKVLRFSRAKAWQRLATKANRAHRGKMVQYHARKYGRNLKFGNKFYRKFR